MAPNYSYADSGWTSWADFVGVDIFKRKRKSLPFDQAQAFAQSLKLRSRNEWREYISKHQLPSGVPKNPFATYNKTEDWVSWPHFLGVKTPNIGGFPSHHNAQRMARHIARTQGLYTSQQWRDWVSDRMSTIRHERLALLLRRSRNVPKSGTS